MPDEGSYVFNWALQSALDGLSATAALREYREAGGHISNATWYAARGEAERFLGEREGIYNEPQHLRPTASEIQTWTTKNASGYIQQVEVLVRPKGTNVVISVPYSATGRTLRSRLAVVREAAATYAGDNAAKYEQEVLGVVYTGTYQMVPGSGA